MIDNCQIVKSPEKGRGGRGDCWILLYVHFQINIIEILKILSNIQSCQMHVQQLGAGFAPE